MCVENCNELAKIINFVSAVFFFCFRKQMLNGLSSNFSLGNNFSTNKISKFYFSDKNLQKDQMIDFQYVSKGRFVGIERKKCTFSADVTLSLAHRCYVLTVINDKNESGNALYMFETRFFLNEPIFFFVE